MHRLVETNGKYEMLKYRLQDVLEMKYSRRKKPLQSIMRWLLDRPIKNPNLHLLSAFALEDVLVVIQSRDSKQVRQVCFLNADKQSFRILRVNFTERVNANGHVLSPRSKWHED